MNGRVDRRGENKRGKVGRTRGGGDNRMVVVSVRGRGRDGEGGRRTEQGMP